MSDLKPDILTTLQRDVVTSPPSRVDPSVFASLRSNAVPAGKRKSSHSDEGDTEEAADDFEEPALSAPPSPAEPAPKRPAARPVGRPPRQPAVLERESASPAAARPSSEETDDMTKRQREKSAMATPGKAPTHNGIPTVLLQEAADIYTGYIPVKIYRRNARGQIAMLGKFDKNVSEVADIDVWLAQEYGGGRYRIECYDPENIMRFASPIPPFEVEINGPMKAQNYSPSSQGDSAIAPMGSMPSMFGMPQMGAPPGMPHAMMPGGQQGRVDPRFLPPFVRGMQPEQQLAWAQANGVPLVPEIPGGGFTQPVMKYTPDALMKEELDRAQTVLEKERREREQERRENERKLEQLRKESDQRFAELTKRMEQSDRERAEERERERERARHAEMAGLRAEIAASQNRRPAIDPAIVTALAPVLATLISTGRDAQNRSLELQSKGISDLMQATLQRSDKNPLFDMIKTVGPVLAPFLKDWWESKSPRAQADLVATLAENQLTSIGMMARLVNDFGANQGGGGEPPWWLPMVQETMRGITKAAEGLTNTSKASVQVVQGPPPNAVSAQQPQQQPQQNGADMFSGFSGQQIAQLIFSDPRMPADFKTREWFQILVAVHSKAPVDQVGPVIAEHIRNLDDNLPQALAGLWDSDKPSDIFGQMFGQLPIGQMDPGYVQALIRKIIQELAEEDQKQAVSQPQQAAQAQQEVPYNMGTQGPSPFPFSMPNQQPQKVG